MQSKRPILIQSKTKQISTYVDRVNTEIMPVKTDMLFVL